MTKITDIARTEKCTLTWARIAKKSCFFVKNSNLLDDVSPLLTMIFSVTLIWILIFKLPAKMIPKIRCNIRKQYKIVLNMKLKSHQQYSIISAQIVKIRDNFQHFSFFCSY